MEGAAEREGPLRSVASGAGAIEKRRRRLLYRLLRSAMRLTGARRGLIVVGGPSRICRATVVVGDWPSRSVADRYAARIGSLGLMDSEASPSPGVVVSAGSPPRPRRVVETGSNGSARVLLRAADRMLGLIYLGGRRPGSDLTAFDVELLEALGHHGALVLASFGLRGRILRLQRGVGDAGVPPRRAGADEAWRSFGVAAPGEDEAPVAEGPGRAV